MFGRETIERFLYSSYDQFAGGSTVPTFLPLLAERFARQRLRALAKVEGHSDGKPTVLFLCVHNAGRSQMAMGFFQHLAGDRGGRRGPAGRSQAAEVNPAAVEAMAERGIDISASFRSRGRTRWSGPPTWWSRWAAGMRARSSPASGTRTGYSTTRPGRTWPTVRPIRDEIERRVRGLLAELNVPVRA